MSGLLDAPTPYQTRKGNTIKMALVGELQNHHQNTEYQEAQLSSGPHATKLIMHDTKTTDDILGTTNGPV